MSSPVRRLLGVSPEQIPNTRLEVDNLNTTTKGAGSVGIDFTLPYIVFFNADTGNHTLTLKGRASADVARSSVPYVLGAGGLVSFPTLPFDGVADGAANGKVYYFYSDVPIAPPRLAAGSGFASSKQVPRQTPATLTSATQMFGLGGQGSFTPLKTGIVLVVITGTVVANGTNLTDIQTRLDPKFGTGSAPANAAATTGTDWGGLYRQELVDGAAGNTNQFTVGFNAIGILTGLTVGTAIWVDLSLGALTGTSASLSAVAISFVELAA